uniref:HMG box domain-containing protein n=1 Tax=Spongospora subterranea TaxID=70186 RepID=A0A0H5RCD3_9EUKA|eukprot:CRZ11406.1 hypothetical protein [Spongospora subterranea]
MDLDESTETPPATPLPVLPDLSIAQLLSIRHDEAFSNARRRKKGPKSAVSAFAYFNAAHLENIVQQCGDAMPPNRIIAIVAEKWEALSDAERRVFDDLAEKDQLRYELQCRPSAAKASELAAKKAKKRKLPGAPKHPKSAYLFFVGENRDLIKSAATPQERNSFTAIAKILGEKWKSLSDEQKSRYQTMADNDKDRYRIEKAEFQQRRAAGILEDETTVPPESELLQDDDDDETAADGTDAAAGGKRRRKHPLAPKHPLSAYLFFVATHRAALTAKHTDKTFTEVAKIIGDIWQSMTNQQRKKYEILASADKKRYEFEMRSWSKSDHNPVNDSGVGTSTVPFATVPSSAAAPASNFKPVIPGGARAPGKRQRDREAAHTITSLFLGNNAVSDGAGTASAPAYTSQDSNAPVNEPENGQPSSGRKSSTPSAFHPSSASTPAQPPPPSASQALLSQYESQAYLAFVRSEAAYIRSVDPDIDSAELDAALRLTWMEMSIHEKMAFQETDANATEFPEDLQDWSTVHVAAYIAERGGLPQYRAAFLDSGLTGATLHTLNSAMLKKQIGVDNLADRKSIRLAVSGLLHY